MKNVAVWVVVDGLSPIATPARSMTGGRRAALRFTGAVAAAEGTAACADVLVDAPEACAFGAGAAVRGVLDRVTGHLVEAEKTPLPAYRVTARQGLAPSQRRWVPTLSRLVPTSSQ